MLTEIVRMENIVLSYNKVKILYDLLIYNYMLSESMDYDWESISNSRRIKGNWVTLQCSK